MNDLKKTQEVEKAIQEMLRKASSNIILPGGEDGDVMKALTEVMANLEQGLMDMYQKIATLGQALDLSRLQLFMVTKILLDKDIVTEQEIEERYKKDVSDELDKMREEMQKHAEKNMQKTVDEHVKNTDNEGKKNE